MHRPFIIESTLCVTVANRHSRLIVPCLVISALAVGLYFFWPDSAKPSLTQTAPQPDRKTQPVLPTQPTPFQGVKATAASSTPPSDSSPSETRPTVDSILADTSLDNSAAARALGALVQDSSLSMNARAEALAHMLNLSVGNESTLLLPLIQSQDFPDTLSGTILNSALNSPLTWQADACLAVISRKTGKELHTQASDHLAFLTGEDHGNDLEAWKLAVQQAQARWAAADKE